MTSRFSAHPIKSESSEYIDDPEEEEEEANKKTLNKMMTKGPLSSRISSATGSEFDDGWNTDELNDIPVDELLKGIDLNSEGSFSSIKPEEEEDEEEEEDKKKKEYPIVLWEGKLSKKVEDTAKKIEQLNKTKDFAKLVEIVSEVVDPDIVDDETFEKVESMLISSLLSLTDADGEQIFDNEHKAIEFLTNLRNSKKKGRKFKAKKYISPKYVGQSLLKTSPMLTRSVPIPVKHDHIVYQW